MQVIPKQAISGAIMGLAVGLAALELARYNLL